MAKKNIILITGGAGFIGSNLAAAFDHRTDDVVICDYFGTTDKWKNLRKRSLYDIVHPDRLLDYLDQHAQDIKVIYHLGAISATTERDVDLIIETNFRLSCVLWDWCTQHKKPFYYASSAATYGKGDQGFDDKTIENLQPLNAYGWSKHLFDQHVLRQANLGQQPPLWAGLKFFNVFGPNEYHKEGMRSVAVQFYEQIKQGQPVKLFKSYHPDYKDGEQKRDFVWVKDCTRLMVKLFDDKKSPGILNVGTGQARSFIDVAKSVFQATNQPENIKFIEMPEPLRNQYQYFTQASKDKLSSDLGDFKFTPLEVAVKEYVHDHLNKEDPYA